jgi:hypothetical protein
MKNFYKILFIFIVFPVLLFGKTLEIEGVRFTTLPDFKSSSAHGYREHRVYVSNISGKEKNVKLFMEESYHNDLAEVSKSFKIAAGDSKIVSLMYPVLNFSSAGIRVEVDGDRFDNKLTSHLRTYRNFYGEGSVLVDNMVSLKVFKKAFDAKSSRRSLEMQQFEGSIAEYSPNWLTYTPYRFLLFYAETYNAFPPAVKKALETYIKLGGYMIVMGEPNLLPGFKFSQKLSRKIQRYKPAQLEANVYENGFGRLAVVSENYLNDEYAKFTSSLISMGSEYWKNKRHRGRFDLEFEDHEINAVSIKWLMIIIYAFAIIIGPINVYWLHRIKKKIWVFWTVPLASAICCLFIVGYYWGFESSIVKLKKTGITLLNEQENMAYSLNYSAFYSSTSNAEGFHFPYSSEVWPYSERYGRTRDYGKNISLTEDQHFSDGWIRPKIPRYFHIRKAQTRRERIDIAYDGNEMVIVNGLGAPIEKLTVCAPDGKFYTGKSIAAGSKKELYLNNSLKATSKASITPSEIFHDDWNREVYRIQRSPRAYLGPGMYIAELKGAPFVAKQFTKANMRHEKTLVLGISSMGDQS